MTFIPRPDVFIASRSILMSKHSKKKEMGKYTFVVMRSMQQLTLLTHDLYLRGSDCDGKEPRGNITPNCYWIAS